MKKILMFLLISVLVIGFIGCGGGNKKETADKAAAGGRPSAAGDAQYDALIGDFEKIVTEYNELLDLYYDKGDMDAADKADELKFSDSTDKLYNDIRSAESKMSEAQRQKFKTLQDDLFGGF